MGGMPNGAGGLKHADEAFGAELWDWFKSIAAAIAIVVLVNSFAVTQAKVQGHSMLPTLSSGERVVVNRLAYAWGKPHRGDVVVLRDPEAAVRDSDYLIKRIVAIDGDRVEIRGGVLYVNGSKDGRLQAPVEDGDFGPYEIAAGFVFVMGDNRLRGQSRDSRTFGAVPVRTLTGRAEGVVWPPAKLGGL